MNPLDNSNVRAGCKCSDQGMHILSDMEEMVAPGVIPTGLHKGQTTFGRGCNKWMVGDTKEWCFVGFDSNCSDRKEYVVDPSYVKRLDSIAEISQFLSSVPCQSQGEDVLGQAETLCRWGRNSILLVLASLVSLPFPMVVIVYLFLRNRCGDLVEWNRQFAVEFSDEDEESDDDFDLSDTEDLAAGGSSFASGSSFVGTASSMKKMKSKKSKKQMKLDKSFSWGQRDSEASGIEMGAVRTSAEDTMETVRSLAQKSIAR